MHKCEQHKSDLLVLDLTIPGLGSLEVIRQLKGHNNQCKIVVLASQSIEQFTLRCMQTGAAGYVSKKDNLSMLSKVINTVMSGYSLFLTLSQGSTENVAMTEVTQKFARLSNREKVVMEHLINGMSNKLSAEVLSLTKKPISTYKTRPYKK